MVFLVVVVLVAARAAVVDGVAVGGDEDGSSSMGVVCKLDQEKKLPTQSCVVFFLHAATSNTCLPTFCLPISFNFIFSPIPSKRKVACNANSA